MEPSIVDEIARYLVPGSMLFLLELYANLLQREEGIKYLKKLQDTITEVYQNNFWNTLKKPVLMVELWDHQEEALREWFDSGGGGIIEMATATGKTLVGLAAALELWKKNGNGRLEVLVLTHSRAILNQWRREAIEKLGFVRDLAEDYRTPLSYNGFRISFNTLQTVYKNPQNYSADFLIVDEAHHAAAAKFRNALNVQSKWRMGLSATIEGRERPRYLEKYIGPKVYTLSIKDAIERKIIPQFDWHIHTTYLNIEERVEFERVTAKIRKLFKSLSAGSKYNEFASRISDGKIKGIQNLSDFIVLLETARYKDVKIPEDWKKLAALILQRRRILYKSGPRIESALELARGEAVEKKCIIFTMDIDSCEKIAKHLNSLTIKAWPVHSAIKQKEVERRLKEFRNSENGALVAPRMLDEGIDVPDAEIGINVASSKTQLQLVQRIGRILRKKPGKEPVFHHFVAIPERKNFIEYDDWRYLDELSWIMDTALRMGIETKIHDVDSEIPKMREKAEKVAEKLLSQDVRISAGGFGTIRIDEILSQFDKRVREKLTEMLERETGKLSDEKWKKLILKAHREAVGLKGNMLNLPGHWWLLITGGRNPERIKKIIGKSLGITYD
ncbi:MAG: DEAD/DEAH box helicase [Candidatus Freyarchaeota archaeon]